MITVLVPDEGVLCTLTAVTALSIVMLVSERRELEVDRDALAGLLVPAVPGVAAGIVLLEHVGRSSLQLGVGIVVLGFVGLQIRWSHLGHREQDSPRYRASAPPAGFAAGVLNGAIATGGPPIAVWLQFMRASANQARHTLAVVFIVINFATILLLVLSAAPPITGDGRAAFLGALLGILVGYRLGLQVLRRVDARLFTRLFGAMLTALGLASLIAGLSGI